MSKENLSTPDGNRDHDKIEVLAQAAWDKLAPNYEKMVAGEQNLPDVVLTSDEAAALAIRLNDMSEDIERINNISGLMAAIRGKME